MNSKKRNRSLGVILFVAIAAVTWMIQFGTTGVTAAGNGETATGKSRGQTPAATTPSHRTHDSTPFYGIAAKENLSPGGVLPLSQGAASKESVPPKQKPAWQETYKPRNARQTAGGKGKAVADKRGQSPSGIGDSPFVFPKERGESIEKVRIIIDSNSMTTALSSDALPRIPRPLKQ